MLVCAAPLAHGAERARELWLAGGSLRLCSELDPGGCSEPLPTRSHPRTAARFAVDAVSTARALDPLLWARAGAPSASGIRLVLQYLERAPGENPYARRELEDLLDSHCLDVQRMRALACSDSASDDTRPWRALLDDERAGLLSALEVPQLIGGQRRVERAYPQLSLARGGVEVVQGLVDAARERSGDERPRIAVVTASAQDPFDAVDFYLDLFEKLGASAQWWPIDAALEQAVSTGRCSELEELRRQHLQLANRDQVFPDLARQQQEACRSPQALAAVPDQVHAIFFSGGDQWRLRQALVDARDAPNDWLRAVQRAHASGALVVGGTSAGAAVQSGAGMPSNGDTASALSPGPLAAPPPSPGCERASRCPDGLDEERFTWWPAGGTGLAVDASVDTHFSERGRELRLLALMHAGGAAWGFGADETSALQVTGEGEERTVTAHGARGGWVFERVQSNDDGVLQARVHYLAPGASLALRGTEASIKGETSRALPGLPALAPVDDALVRGAMRSAATRLARGKSVVRLGAAGGAVELRRSRDTRAWQRGESVGVSHLDLRYAPGASAGALNPDGRQEPTAQQRKHPFE
jgi:cyanophycinase-like exopeptidase